MSEFDFENYVNSRLLEISDLEQRVLYKEIVGDLLKKLYFYNETAYKELEQRILSESNLRESDFAVSLTLTDKKHYDVTDSYMYPMKLSDTLETEYSLNDIESALKEKSAFRMYTVFFKISASSMNDLLSSNRVFHGFVQTEKREYKASFKITRNNEYLQLIQQLYEIFIANSRAWNTVCQAYLTKLCDVNLYETEEIGRGEQVQKIQVDFEEYEGCVLYDVIPMWNLRSIREKTNTYPDAAIDKINYEHMIFAHRLKPNCQYLIKNTDVEIANIRRQNGDLIITCPVDKPVEWEMYQVNKESNEQTYMYPVLTNMCKESFSNNFAEMNRKSIKTKAEMARVIESFQYNDVLKFIGYEIVQQVSEELVASNYNMDDFIIDEVRMENRQQSLVLSFVPNDREYYLNEDIMSFLITQIQKIFPEYLCLGNLV